MNDQCSHFFYDAASVKYWIKDDAYHVSKAMTSRTGAHHLSGRFVSASYLCDNISGRSLLPPIRARCASSVRSANLNESLVTF